MDNIPFNQPYSLAEDCTDRYYTKVIKTLTHLLKSSFNDRQTILVNTARALKIPKSYGNRQTKFWKVLSKYHKLSDHFYNLQTTLQTEFNLLIRPPRKASKTYTKPLTFNKHILHPSVSTLIPSIQNWHSLRNRSKSIVFIPTPKQTLYRLMHQCIWTSTVKHTLPDIQPQVVSHAENTKEDSAPVTANSEEYSTPPQDSDRFESQSESVQNPAEYSLHQDAEQFRQQHQDRQRSQLEDIQGLGRRTVHGCRPD